MTSLQRFASFHSTQLLQILLIKRQTPSQSALFLSLPIYSFFPPSAQADWKRSSKLISQTCDFQFQTPDTNPTHTLNIHAEGPELRHCCPDLRSPNHTHLISLFKERRERLRKRRRKGEEEEEEEAVFTKRWKPCNWKKTQLKEFVVIYSHQFSLIIDLRN